MNTKTTTMTLASILFAFATIGAPSTFENISFNTATYDSDDPLGVTALKTVETNVTTISQNVETVSQTVATVSSKVAVAEENITTISSNIETISGRVDAVESTASSASDGIATLQEAIPDMVKAQMTNDTVVIGSVVGGSVMESTPTTMVFAVKKDIYDMNLQDGDMYFGADKIRFDASLASIFFGDTTLQDLLAQSGQGEVNTIVTVKTNGVALVPDQNRAINIIIPEPEEISLDGKLDETNGVAYGDLKVYPMPSGTVGQTHTIITHESMSIGDAEYKEDGIIYNGETYEFSSDTNGLARLKDIPTISTNGVAITPDDSKNVNIIIPDAGEGNVIEVVKTNGVAVAISSNKEVDIAIPTVPDISGMATKQELSELTITAAKVTDLDSYKNPTISAAALTAIDGISNAQDIATIKSTLTNFLQQFVISAP